MLIPGPGFVASLAAINAANLPHTIALRAPLSDASARRTDGTYKTGAARYSAARTPIPCAMNPLGASAQPVGAAERTVARWHLRLEAGAAIAPGEWGTVAGEDPQTGQAWSHDVVITEVDAPLVGEAMRIAFAADRVA